MLLSKGLVDALCCTDQWDPAIEYIVFLINIQEELQPYLAGDLQSWLMAIVVLLFPSREIRNI
jgi:hypothetical protein